MRAVVRPHLNTLALRMVQVQGLPGACRMRRLIGLLRMLGFHLHGTLQGDGAAHTHPHRGAVRGASRGRKDDTMFGCCGPS